MAATSTNHEASPTSALSSTGLPLFNSRSPLPLRFPPTPPPRDRQQQQEEIQGMGDAPTTAALQIPKEEELHMPPGFRFHPTDAEIVLSYLLEKLKDAAFSSVAIGEIDLNGCEPWDLPARAKMGEKEWFFFWRRDRKYPTGTRTNRATQRGYWKATGKDKEIYKARGCLVGMKKTLVFYLGRAPKGEKSNWVMHEYRLAGKLLHTYFSTASKNDWVVCRVFHKNEPQKNDEGAMSRTPSCSSNGFDRFVCSTTMPPLSDSSPMYTDGSFLPASWTPENHRRAMPSYPNINPLFLDIPFIPNIVDPNHPGYYDAPPAHQGSVEYLHHGHVETRDAVKGKCKVEEEPPRSLSTVEREDPGSPSCSGGPLANLEDYIWT